MQASTLKRRPAITKDPPAVDQFRLHKGVFANFCPDRVTKLIDTPWQWTVNNVCFTGHLVPDEKICDPSLGIDFQNGVYLARRYVGLIPDGERLNFRNF